VFVLTLHPQVIGQSHRISRLEELYEHMLSKPDIEFRTMETAAEAWREQN
jgi:adenosine/AMP kinase